MPIYTSPDTNRPKVLEDYPTTFMDMVSQSAAYAASENITAMASRWAQRAAARAVQGDAGERFYTVEEANAIGKEYGLEPTKRSMSQMELELNIEQAQRQRLRESRMASYRGPGATVTRVATGFLASFADPTELLTSLIPVVPLLRKGKLALGLAEGAMEARTMGRAMEGAIEGATGALVTEPARYMFANDEQMDYDLTDSLMNVTFGAGLGSALHVGIGKLVDFTEASAKRAEAIRAGEKFATVEDEVNRLRAANENATVPERIAAAAPETHPNALRAHMAELDGGYRSIAADEVLALDSATETPHTPSVVDEPVAHENVMASAERIRQAEQSHPASLTSDPAASVEASARIGNTAEQVDFENPDSINADVESTQRVMEDSTARALVDNPELAEALGVRVEGGEEGAKPKLVFPEIEAADTELANTTKNMKQALKDVADCIIGF